MVNIHKYEYDVSKIDKKCILCGRRITDEEFEYEDYFIVFRGFTKDSCYGFVCLKCMKKGK